MTVSCPLLAEPRHGCDKAHAWLRAGGMEVTESQLQILALAEEVERLQDLVAAEREARDELRRRFLKMSAPRPPPLTLAQYNTGDMPSTTTQPQVEPLPVNSQPEAVQPSTDHNGTAADTQQGEHASVVHKIQQAEQSVSVDSSQHVTGRQRKRGFSIWGFITGEDRIRT